MTALRDTAPPFFAALRARCAELHCPIPDDITDGALAGMIAGALEHHWHKDDILDTDDERAADACGAMHLAIFVDLVE